MKKMKHFDSPEAALAYMQSEMVATLDDDMRDLKASRDPLWKDLRDKIHDLEAIENHVAIIGNPTPPQSLCILRAFMSALPEMEDDREDVSGGDVVQTLSDYWPDFKRAVADDETRQARDKKADEFIAMIARMKTEEEFGEDAPPSEDWISTLNDLIVGAKALTKKGK